MALMLSWTPLVGTFMTAAVDPGMVGVSVAVVLVVGAISVAAWRRVSSGSADPIPRRTPTEETRALRLEYKSTELTAEVVASRARRFYRAMFDESRNGVVVVDFDGRVVYANPEAPAVLGIEAADLVGEPLFGCDAAAWEEPHVLRSHGKATVTRPGPNGPLAMTRRALPNNNFVIEIVAAPQAPRPTPTGESIDAWTGTLLIDAPPQRSTLSLWESSATREALSGLEPQDSNRSTQFAGRPFFGEAD